MPKIKQYFILSSIFLISALFLYKPGFTQVYNYVNNIPSSFFHQLFDKYNIQFSQRRDAKSQYIGGVLTILDLSDELIKKNGYYTNLNYNSSKKILSLVGSIVDQNQTAYVNINVNQVNLKEWSQLQKNIADQDVININKNLSNILLNHPVLSADIELNITQPLDSKSLASIIPVFESAPESLALSSYPVHVHSRATYYRESGELYVEVDIDYEDRANIDFILQSITHGDLILDDDNNELQTDKFIINPYFVSLNFENISLIQDMIKLELGSKNEFVSAIVRHKIAFDIKEKAQKAEDPIIKSYYESLAQFIENPISFKITAESRTKSSKELIKFWYRLMSVVNYQSIIQAMPKPKSKKDVGLIIGNKVRQHHYQSHLKQLLKIINNSIEINYFVNGQAAIDN